VKKRTWTLKMQTNWDCIGSRVGAIVCCFSSCSIKTASKVILILFSPPLLTYDINIYKWS
jgi:hypothetical protein